MLEKKVNGEMHSPQSLYRYMASVLGQHRVHGWRWVKSLFAALTRLRSALEQELQKRRAITELANMDDRMLRDIGICRSEIESAVRASPGAAAGQMAYRFPRTARLKMIDAFCRGSVAQRAA